jgi:hypothetical protein
MMNLNDTNFREENFIRSETKKYGFLRTKTYIFKCLKKECERLVKAQSHGLKTQTGYCASCSAKITRTKVIQKHQLRPFEALYNKFCKKVKVSNELNYDDFLKFTEINNCHYCDFEINWKKKSAYNLDRINNDLPYTNGNCVVCCGLCNFTKRDQFSYEEFCLLGQTIKKIREYRNSK